MIIENSRDKKIVDLLYKELSYEIQGAAFEVRKDFGLGHKEQIYQKAYEEELIRRKIAYEREPAIKIHAPKDGKYIGLYRPDFVVEGKIIVELKAQVFLPKAEIRKIYDYLRNSDCQLGYLINFGSEQLYVKRIIFSEEKKPRAKQVLASLSLLLALFSGLFLASPKAQAALLYSGSASEIVSENQTFVVDWYLDTQGQAINSVNLKLNFTQETLQVSDATAGASAINLWIKAPEFSNDVGSISLIGGIAGGVETDKLMVFRTTFKAVQPGPAKILLDENSTVLLSDGKGTVMKLTFQPLSFPILPADEAGPQVISPSHPDETVWYRNNTVEIMVTTRPKEMYSFSFSSNSEIFPDDQVDDLSQPLSIKYLIDGIYYFRLNSKIGNSNWQPVALKRFQIDNTPPQPFTPVVALEPTIFNGKPFVSFTTTDKVSGIAYYEVKIGFLDSWTKTNKTYYVLPKLNLSDQVQIRAVDLAGNVQFAEVQNNQASGSIFTNKWLWFIIFMSLVLAGLFVFVRKKRKQRNLKQDAK